MWTVENRGQYNRDEVRYPSDVTDEEWAEIGPLIPPARRGGRKRTVNIREVFNRLMFVLSTGCQWRAAAERFSPRSTVFDYFGLWQADGTLGRIHATLYVKCREHPEPGQPLQPPCIIDSKSVKSAEKGGARLIRRGLTRANRSKARSATC